MWFLHRWRFIRVHQRSADTAQTTFDDGRLIYNAALASASAELPHPFAMVLPDIRIFQIPLVGFPQLFPPTSPPAFIAAVGLTSVARPTDKKHQAATDRPAK